MTAIIARHWRVPAAYLVIGTALYWSALGAFFLSDDFEFLGAVASSAAGLASHPDGARFIRPLVILAYAACYRAFGLHPLPYHLLVFALHVFNAWCVFLIARRVLPAGDRLGAFLAGLLFLVFSSHSEAVAWPAGIADPLAAAFLLPAFLTYLHALEPGAGQGWAWISCALMFCGALAKEVWVVLPPIVLVHALVLAPRDGAARRRAATVIVAAGIGVLVYLLARRVLLGGVATGYAGLGTSLESGVFVEQARVFVLRVIVPGGLRALDIWQRRLDLVIWPLVALVVLARGRDRAGRVALFAACATVIALAPTLPLTISIVNTESERFTYLPTVFSCLFVVAAAIAVLRRPSLVALACAPLILWHGVVLTRNAHRFRDAGEMARGIIDTFAAGVRRHDPEARQPVFLLNLPDNLNGVYVFRRGFYPAIELFAPDVADSTRRTTGIATNSLGALRDRVTARQTAQNRFALEGLAPGSILQNPIHSSAWYRIVDQQPASYTVQFEDGVSSAPVFYTTGGRVEYVGLVRGKQ